MLKREQNLIDAAREILGDYLSYGVVLQQDEDGDYGDQSPIGMLAIALKAYKGEVGRKAYACESCSQIKTDVVWREETEQYECKECYQVWEEEQGLSDSCESCRKCGETTCGNDVQNFSCFEPKI